MTDEEFLEKQYAEIRALLAEIKASLVSIHDYCCPREKVDEPESLPTEPQPSAAE